MASISTSGNLTISGGSQTVNGSIVNSIGSPLHNHNQNANYISTVGSHAHTFTGYMNINPSLHIDMNYNKKIICVKEGKEVLEVHEGMLKLNEVDTLEIEELLSVFKYIKSDYPNLYADLILKGIIK